jgi:hypothetical protein
MNLHEILGVMSDAANATQAEDAWAGGTVALWVKLPDERIFCVTEGNPPEVFGPVNDHELDVNAFAVGVYPSEAVYMDGSMFEDPLFIVPADLEALRATIAALAQDVPPPTHEAYRLIRPDQDVFDVVDTPEAVGQFVVAMLAANLTYHVEVVVVPDKVEGVT